MSYANLATSNLRYDIIEASLVLPLRGVPRYYVVADTLDALDVGTSIRIETNGSEPSDFDGIVSRSAQHEGRLNIEAVGSGPLSLEHTLASRVEPAGYLSLSAGFLFGRLAAESGVALAPGVEATLSELTTTRWQRVGGLAQYAVGLLSNLWGLTWRVLSDSTLWVGTETWPAYPDEWNTLIVDNDAATTTLRLSHLQDSATLRPGQMIWGRRVERVVFRITPDAMRIDATYLQDDAGTRAANAAAVRSSLPQAIYGASHEARVALDHGDGTVDVITGNPDLDGPDGVVSVPVRVGLARARQVLQEGQVVRLRFEGSQQFPAGDPRRPYVEAMAQDPSADRGIVRLGDFSRAKFSITTSSILGATAFLLTPWREGIPRPDLAMTVTLGADTAPGSGIPNTQTFETEGPAVTASEEVFLA